MTAPTRTRSKPSTAPPERKTGRKDSGGRGRNAGTRSAAAERAYARRAQRVDQARRSGESVSGAGESSGARNKLRLRMPRSRASFVLLIMAMLAAGVVATLWLTTQAIAGSYKLERLHENNAELAERVAKLERVVTKRESATWLAEQARQLGMVPGGTPAKLVVHPDGSVTVVGEPKKVTAPAPPPAPAPKPQPPEPGGEPESAPPGDGSAADEQQAQGNDPEQAPPEQAPPDQARPEQESAEHASAAQGTQAAGEGG